jgi:hypothetical protein
MILDVFGFVEDCHFQTRARFADHANQVCTFKRLYRAGRSSPWDAVEGRFFETVAKR